MCLSALCTALFGGASRADDIDIYKAQFAGQAKPNIVFVLDYSGSMQQDVYGNNTSDSGLPAKIDVLKTALAQVLEQNQDRINAGIGSIFSSSPSGVRWPVSDLSADANTVDPDIPAGSYTVKDILAREINRRGAGGSTSTVGALTETALYLKGAAVMHDNRNPLRPRLHEPPRWDVGIDDYTGGSYRASLRHAYLPHDAYAVGVNEPDNFTYCSDYSVSGGTNYCAGQATYDCQTNSAGSSQNAEGESYSYNEHVSCKVPHPDAWRGAQYISPITQSCQQNAIVLISDGKPTTYSNNAALQSVVGSDHSACEDLSASIFGAGPGGEVAGNCGPEIVRELANNDQVFGIPGSIVNTYTVGFNVDGPGKQYLELLAEEGEGRFFQADQPEQLSAALLSAIDDIAGESENFAPFSIDINKATFSHDNRVYFNLFKPSRQQGWEGNLKGYFIGPDGFIDTQNQPATVVQDGVVRFVEGSQSFWSATADGNEIAKGGASEKLQTQSVRALYTYPYTGSPGGVNLSSSPSYLLNASNALVDETIMGLPVGSPLRDESLNWLQNAPMGDPLHTLSTRVQYDGQTVVYTMTNQGLLHAIDATSPTDPAAMDHSGGQEIFAFMPPRLLIRFGFRARSTDSPPPT